ncbi:MAG TPA: hypothetical protein VMK82_01495 [Steroidobacteraceae bacterium]|nr:hypothetical protein [Steroidobacteraceae bacterium]
MKHSVCIVGSMLLAASLHAAEPATVAEPAVITSPAAANPATPVGRDSPRRQEVTVAPAQSVTAAPAAPAAPAAEAPGQTAPAPPAPRGTSADRIELGATQITGNAELPRVMYVVPWKRAELGELAGKPARSLLDEVLAPVDRDVFRRQNRYYDALQPDGSQ